MAVVQRLRQRIFTVSQKGTLKQVRNFLIRGGLAQRIPSRTIGRYVNAESAIRRGRSTSRGQERLP